MWRDPESNSNTTGTNNKYDSENTFTYHIRLIIYLMGTLAVLRIFTLDIMGAISDGLGVLMMFFFLYGRTKCMAIFILFNGVMGFFISYSKYSQLKQLADLKGEYSGSDSFAIAVIIYGIFVYLYECILAVIGIRKYPWEGIIANTLNQPSSQPYQSSYGSISNSQPAQSNYVPFQGRGTTVG